VHDRSDAGSRDSAGGILDIMYDTFDYAACRETGSAGEALNWVSHSSLLEPDKAALGTFVERFPEIVFYRDTAVLLDHLERRNAVVLPPWLRVIRQVLSGPGPDAQVRFDDFDYSGSPRTDRTGDDGDLNLWYEDNFFGYRQDEERDLLRSGAECYPILGAGPSANNVSVGYLLAADLGNPDNQHIIDLCDEDIMDDLYADRPGTESTFPAFESYARMLSHIVECRAADGTVIRARTVT
jgi:hypothetical protein